MKCDSAVILKEIDAVISFRETKQKTSQFDDMSDLGDVVLSEIVVVLSDAIQRLSPPGSTYREKAQQLVDRYGMGGFHVQQQILTGILQALRRAYECNYLQSVQDLVHADLFSDFFDMAEYLLSENYKDPAAVIAGSVLEENLRNLCVKNHISTKSADGKPKKASAMNDDLAKATVYGKMEQKNITAWLDLRNKAAHGQYTEYDKKQVELFMQGVRDFLTRFPA